MNPPIDTTELPLWLVNAGVAEGRGLEVGPLNKPRLAKDRFRVQYVDHASTEDLRQKYASDDAMRDHLSEIVEVDFVWTGEGPLIDVVGDAAPFDFVFASHVAEHVPDLIGWLRQIGEVLGDDGRLCLAVPDKRLCFDVNRDLTTMADLVDAHLRGLQAPGFRQIYDFHSRIIEVDAAALWAGSIDYSGCERTDLDPDQWAYELCRKHQQTGEYLDGHCQVFTPASFLDVYARLVALDLIEYRIAEFQPSVPGTIEFRATLAKMAASMPAAERRQIQLASIPSFDDTVPRPRVGAPAPGEALPFFGVSAREESVIRAKRRLVESAKSLLSRGRSGSGGTA